jgi:predicted AAA+ superfamily ATPase
MEEELRCTPLEFHRYMYDRVIWEDRMIGIIGPRGVGKSTMVKQFILSHPDRQDWLYVSADHTYFSSSTLTDLADEFVKEGGRYLVIDEIHKYHGWSRELKQIYDSHAGLNVIFTGSSILDIKKGSADLSRRVLIFEMQGLSFKEYLKLFKDIDLPVYTLDEILAHKVTLPSDIHPLPLFREYLTRGYYPFCSLPGYDIRLQQVIAQTMEVDIPQFAGMNVSTARKLRKMLDVISKMAPFKPSFMNLATELKVSKNDVPDYMLYLEQAGMIGQLRDDTGGIRGLGKVEKVYIDNPNLMNVLAGDEPNKGNMRETFFFNQMRVSNDVISSRISDFRIGDITFEVGGAKKGKKQLTGAETGIVVRDDIEYGYHEFVPLWQFGLNY